MKVLASLKRANEAGGFSGMVFWPIWLRAHVVDYIKAGSCEEPQRFLKQSIFSRPCIGEYEIEVLTMSLSMTCSVNAI
jgi:hypothetical protein